MALPKPIRRFRNILYFASIGELRLSDIIHGFKRFVIFLINIYDPEGAKAAFSSNKNINGIIINVYDYKIRIGFDKSKNINYANTLSHSKSNILKSHNRI